MQWSFYSEPMEFRAFRERTSKKTGEDFGIIVVEDTEGYQNEISVRDSSRFPEMRRLLRGHYYRFPVTVVANAQWQFSRIDDKAPIMHLTVTDDGEMVDEVEHR